MADGAPVHVVGSINTDLVAYVERLPAPGETLFGERFAQFAGGKGANQAVAAARAGAAVSFHGAVGDDAFGHAGRAGLRQDGIAVGGLLTLPEHAALRNLIVTLGAAGSLWAHRDESGAAALHRQPALPVTAVDTVGAGDCFCGVFAAAMAAGAAVADALHRATAAAALAVQRSGAQPSMPSADEIEQAQRTLPPGTTVTAS